MGYLVPQHEVCNELRRRLNSAPDGLEIIYRGQPDTGLLATVWALRHILVDKKCDVKIMLMLPDEREALKYRKSEELAIFRSELEEVFGAQVVHNQIILGWSAKETATCLSYGWDFLAVADSPHKIRICDGDNDRGGYIPRYNPRGIFLMNQNMFEILRNANSFNSRHEETETLSRGLWRQVQDLVVNYRRNILRISQQNRRHNLSTLDI